MSHQPVQSGAAKISAILDALGTADASAFPEGMTVAEMSRALDRDKSIVSRQLKSLLETELISRDDEGRYMLSWRLFALASRAGDQRITRLAMPVMRRLSDTVGERSHLTVWSSDEILTVHSESSGRLIEAHDWVGRTVPALTTASGVAMMMDHDADGVSALAGRVDPSLTPRLRSIVADIERSRERGYSFVTQVADPEICGIGAPIRDFRGQIVAAINISGPTYRIEPNRKVLADHVKAAARGIDRTARRSPAKNDN